MDNYICKIATVGDMNKKWDYEINKADDDKANWIVWKELHITNFNKGLTIPYYGFLNDEIICEATAVLDKRVIQNGDNLINDETAYLMAFRTNLEYQGKGYFRELFKYMINDLKSRGYKYVTLGVEPSEVKNKEIYSRYGFNDFIKENYEKYQDDTKVLVEYYRKTL